MIDDFVTFLLSDLSPERTLPILTNHYCKPLGPGPYILFNIEQLTRPRILKEVYARAVQPDIAEVWDYSHINVTLLRSKGIAARHVPVQTTKMRADMFRHIIKNSPKNYDVGFCGVAPERRQAILTQLANFGVKVLLMTNLYGNSRDASLAQCKMLLNIHQTNDHMVFESIRCDPWLRGGMMIVSESSMDDDPRCINVPYDKLVETVLDVLGKMGGQYTLQRGGDHATSS